jgi:intracellular septation protein A
MVNENLISFLNSISQRQAKLLCNTPAVRNALYIISNKIQKINLISEHDNFEDYLIGGNIDLILNQDSFIKKSYMPFFQYFANTIGFEDVHVQA